MLAAGNQGRVLIEVGVASSVLAPVDQYAN